MEPALTAAAASSGLPNMSGVLTFMTLAIVTAAALLLAPVLEERVLHSRSLGGSDARRGTSQVGGGSHERAEADAQSADPVPAWVLLGSYWRGVCSHSGTTLAAAPGAPPAAVQARPASVSWNLPAYQPVVALRRASTVVAGHHGGRAQPVLEAA